MKKPSLIKRFFSFLLRLCVVLVLMAAIAVGSFEGVTYYLTGSFTSVKKAVKEETDQSGTEDSTEATTVDNKNMENTLVFVHDDMNNKDYTALNMYNTKTEAMDVLLLPCNAQVSVSSTLLKEIRNTMTEARKFCKYGSMLPALLVIRSMRCLQRLLKTSVEQRFQDMM